MENLRSGDPAIKDLKDLKDEFIQKYWRQHEVRDVPGEHKET